MYYLKSGDLLKKIQETLYIGQWHLSPFHSRHFGTSHISPRVFFTVQNTQQNPLLASPSATPSYFLESHQQSAISSLSKVILVLGKAKSHRAPNLGCGRLSHPVVMFRQKTLHNALAGFVMKLLITSCP